MESDDRFEGVVKHLDDALAELDKMGGWIGLYKSQLGVRKLRNASKLLPRLTLTLNLLLKAMTDDLAHIVV